METVRVWAPAIASIFAAGSAVFATYQYYVSRGDLHVARTLDFVQRFDSGRFSKAQDEATIAIAAAQETTRARLKEPTLAGLSPAERAALADKLFVAALYGDGIRSPPSLPLVIADLTGFFNGLQTCIAEGMCDEKTAHGFFDRYALSLWCDIYPAVTYERDHGREGFALGLQQFVRSSGCE